MEHQKSAMLTPTFQMGNHLCIRLTGEVIAEILQTLSNGLVIFNNAVVHETDESTGKVGVSIADF